MKDENGDPLQGVTIVLEGTPWGIITDDDGYYSIDNIRPNTYTIKSSLTGFIESYIDVDLTKKSKVRVDLKLKASEIMLEEMKPVLYLYPDAKKDIKVSIDHIGNLTHCYPRYSEKGWSVTALPDGTLFDKRDNKEYYCLYWEAERKYDYNIRSGFVVKGKDTREFLEEKLEILGLNRREANEFIIFWLPLMENSRYNLVHFSTDEYQSISKLNIDPKPETLIRVHMVIQSLNKPIDIEEQIFTPIKRSGYTALEWGGTIVK